jgi:hypothetical protein
VFQALGAYMATPINNGVDTSANGGAEEVPRFAAQHFTVKEISAMWKLSEDAVRRIFEKEPGVLVLAEERRNSHKRRYRTLRIPASVLERVYRRMSQV